MPSPACKTPRRRENARPSVPSFRFVGPLQKVQRAVLFSLFVEATLRNISMLTFVRLRIGPPREEAPAAHLENICADVKNHNLQHAEALACMAWRVRVEDSITVAGLACLDTRFRNVSRLTSSIGPRPPGVQPAEHFPRVKCASVRGPIPSLAPKSLSSEETSRSPVPGLFTRRNELVQDRCVGDNV